MSTTNRRFLIAYILLVGLPLLGLAGVLKAGRKLAAPISVSGTWKLEVDDRSLGSQPCLEAIRSLHHSGMTITQSGQQLALNVAGESRMASNGTINGRDLNAEIALSQVAGQPACGSDAGLKIAATLEPMTLGAMLGTISVNNCASCLPVQFHAERQAGPARREPR